MKTLNVTEVKPGQIWKDNDERTTYPELTVLRVDNAFAYCQRGPLKTRIRIDRMLKAQHGRGYTYLGKKR
jgi:hypothetical protein